MGSTKNPRNYFGKEILVLKIFGVSLTGNDSLPYKIYTFLFLPPIVFLYPFLDFYEYFKHDATAIADIIGYQMATFISLCKIVVVLRNRIKIGKLLVKLEREPFIPNLDRGGQMEEELHRECLRVTSTQALVFWGGACLSLISSTSYTITKRTTSSDYHDWQLPYGPFTLFNATYSPSFEINWLYQSISVTFLGYLFITIDLLIATILGHITYQFKILQNFLKRLVEISHRKMMEGTRGLLLKQPNNSALVNETECSITSWKYLKKSIQQAVEYHVAIIDIAKEMNEVFSDSLLVAFLTTLVLLCFSTYLASSADTLQSAAKHMGDGLVVCVDVAIICFWGEQVFQESQLVGTAAYESNFVGTDVRFQKMLIFIIRRSQNPIKITVGKFAYMGFVTFLWLMQTSYSYFMVLRNAKV